MGRSLVKWLLWGLIVLVHLHGHRGCFEEERMGLLEIKEEFVRSTLNEAITYLLPSRPQVYILPSWVDDHKSECCEWERVTCNSTTGHVTHLSLHNIWEFDVELVQYIDFKYMVWFLNVSLFESFKELRSLDLSYNAIGGWIEHKGSESLLRLNKLESLDLDANSFNWSIIQSLRLLTSLKSLNLSYNALEGSLPTKELSVFEDLEILDLRNNRLNGSETVQGSISLLRLKKLERLDLCSNVFNQSIIQSLRLLKSLKTLTLSDNRLEGTFPAKEFSVFDDLEILDLSHNQLNGSLTIQEFKGLSKLSKLKHLDLSRNHFDKGILRSLGALSKLTSLKLDSNRMEGPLYDQDLASLRSLEVLNLGGNNFNGSLPKCLCGLKKLEDLDLRGNSFEGTFPTCLYNLTSLQRLDLALNKFRGNISSLTAGLTSLKYIDLSHNLFEGFSFGSFANHSKLELFKFQCENNEKVDIETENSDWVPLFQLETLLISNCALNKLSHQLPTFLFHQHSLRQLDLSYNGLKGPFPDWLFRNNTKLEYFSLTDNSFTGHFHLPLFLNSTYRIDVSNNQLIGKLQRNIGEILPKIEYLFLSNNSFTGSLPSSIGNMSLLDEFDVSFNNFSGEVPKELLVGCSKLSDLVISNNYFDGHLDWVPLYNLTTLFRLKINQNQFSGAMPNELHNFISNIDLLDVSSNKLSGKIPTWICNQTYSSDIYMQNNYFEGQIPCETITVDFLDLSHNLLDGSLPLWSSTQLKHLQLEGNIFSGSIPEPFLNMSELLTLDISDNKLSGSIPSVISKISSLRILLLGGNHLSGNISTQLCQLTNITLMDLSRNLFSGTIPHCFGRTLSFSSSKANYWGYSPIGQSDGIIEYFVNTVEVNFVTKYRLSSYKGGILNYMSGLDLSCNNLTGGIPLELGQLQEIHALNLSHNQLTGSIPKSFSNLSEIESLDLSHNRLSGEIPPQLIELTFLAVFNVAYNNLSGRTPDMKAQFGTFNASSYDGNQFLCGVPLEKSCGNNRDDSTRTPTQSSNVSDEKWHKIDQVVFFTCFLVTYIMFFLGVIIVLYINPHWRLWCFNLAEDFMYSCYFCVANTLR